MSSEEEILNNFIINMEYIKKNYINIYNINPQQITVELPQIFIIHANNTLTSINIEHFTREQFLREYTLVHEAIDLFETLLKDDIFTNEEKITFSDILRLYNDKRVELKKINPNPRTGGKKSRKGNKSKIGKKYRKGKKSKKRV
jgi:hypothetical protein